MGFKFCSMDISDYVFSRRCFMTGEYCSKQLNVQRERARLHKNGEINAFVIMSFSNMSDVVYKWRIKTYVESLAQNLYFRSEEGIGCDEWEKKYPEVVSLSGFEGEDTPDSEEKKRFSAYLRSVSKKDEEALSGMTSLCCYANGEEHRKAVEEDLKKREYHRERKVQKINIIRADSNPSSNFVICNRVCQQMQIADLVVVDVSDENTNVFYELGMAIALRKLILPICYSESYFAMQLPEGVKEEQQRRLERFRKDFRYNPAEFAEGEYGYTNNNQTFVYKEKEINSKDTSNSIQLSRDEDEDRFLMHNRIVNDLEHHIDCYPWRRQLFENFGIRYKRESEDATNYLPFDVVKIKLFGFSDLKYDRFPYLDKYSFPKKNNKEDKLEEEKLEEEKLEEEKLGEKLYSALRDAYNNAGSGENTLVVYSMDRFLNPDDGWQCIVNYYRAYVELVQDEHCFCGDRVGLLVQPASIAEPIKDAEERRHLLYNIGEIIQIGMNQATYLADREKVKPPEYLPDLPDLPERKETGGEQNSDEKVELGEWDNELRLFFKEYSRNRSFPIYPKDPIYINRVKSGAHDDLFEDSMENAHPKPANKEYKKGEKDVFFCLYHTMLRNLKYVNEIAVDITQNSVQSLFWLGVAHASGIYAITIRHDKTEDEKKQLAEAGEERGQHFPSGSGRRIFDISGLWTAVLHAYDTEGFYTQLKRVQLGIEQRSKLMLRDADSFSEEMDDVFWDPNISSQSKRGFEKEAERVYTEKKKRETELLESFYRDRFWRPMLRRNRLEIYACQDNVSAQTENDKVTLSRSYVAAWDAEAISALSLYLSKRKLIGEYQFKLQNRVNSPVENPEEIKPEDLAKKSYICVGAEVNPFTIKETIPDYLNKESNGGKKIIEQPLYSYVKTNGTDCARQKKQGQEERGFEKAGNPGCQIVRPFADQDCATCSIDETKRTCGIKQRGEHTQLGQLLLWREESADKEYAFRASLAGVSGPATRALSTLFVDEAQKEDAFGGSNAERSDNPKPREDSTKSYPEARKKWDDAKIVHWEKESDASTSGHTAKPDELSNEDYREKVFPMLFPLSSLQEKIRDAFLSEYTDRLDTALNQKLNKKYEEKKQTERADYITRVKHTAKLYLSATLYRCFFPFLSHEDEARICNGLDLFIHKMMWNAKSPFAKVYKENSPETRSDGKEQSTVLDNINFSAIILNEDVDKYAKATVDTLRELIKSFQAVEAFYEVTVDYTEEKTRHIHGIRLIETDYYCIFKPQDNARQEIKQH